MTSTQTFTSHHPNAISIIDPDQIQISKQERIEQSLITNNLKTTWTERLKSYFTTNDGRIILSDLLFTLICVILQHVLGTCDHSVSDGTNVIKWHVFTPPCKILFKECNIPSCSSSWSWSTYCCFLLRSFLDDFSLLYRTNLGVFNNRCSCIEKTRFDRPWNHCSLVFRGFRF